ncbi:unnamed protein product [Rotaria sp. Silwood2]|nr:unnamed protein product [Rotaria sp. Silwood2]
MTSDPNSHKVGKDIWTLTDLEEIVAAIASLGDRYKELNHETWRLDSKTKLSTSLSEQPIKKLELDNTERRRHSLYNIWRSTVHCVPERVKKELERRKKNIIDEDNDNISAKEEVSVQKNNNVQLLPDPSLPLPEPPNTRTRKGKIVNDSVDFNGSPTFRAQISGAERHDAEIATMKRQLCGEERYRVGKRANEIGPLAVFREQVEAADENLLAAGNYTECNTIEVIKKATADYRKKYQIDENIYTACRIIASAYHKSDVTSTRYVQVSGEMPFCAHLFSEPQIELYANYCKKEKYSYVHIDATGGVLKRISGQGQTLLYAMVFKDGTDSINTIPLVHAFLSNHTVPNIDEESVTLLSDHKKTLKEAKKENDKLKVVDEYFRSSTAIIHQSPFNIEAIRRYPHLKTLINNKFKYDTNVNPLFSPLLIRIFYRWWAYLPLWTGVLWNFEERYSNNLEINASVIYNPIRYSNAVIESYFRTFKSSILKHKVGTQPQKIIEELHRSIQVQLKALQYKVT